MSFVDWARLAELRDDIGEDAFADVAFLFVAEISEKLDALNAAPDMAASDDFHFLRGSAANLGFSAMVAACAAAEEACCADRPPDIDAVARAFRGALAEVAPHMPELAAA